MRIGTNNQNFGEDQVTISQVARTGEYGLESVVMKSVKIKLFTFQSSISLSLILFKPYLFLSH